MHSNRRIVHILHTLDPGGCEHMLLSLLPFLRGQGWEVLLITLGEAGTLAPRFEQAGVRVESGFFRSPLDIVSGTNRLRQLLRAWQPGLLIAHLLYADALARLFRGMIFGIPIIPVIHSTYHTPGLWLARCYERLTAPWTRQAIAVSPAVKTMAIRRGFKPRRISIIPNPVDTERFHPTAPSISGSKSIKLICIANFIDYKRHEDLLKAFKISLKDCPELELLLAGQGPEETTLRQQVERYGLKDKVRFLGRRENVPELLRESDVFVLPSLFEGMSIAIMEAMATGLPVIASDIPENRVLIKDQVTGRLVPTKDVGSLATVITAVARDSALRLQLGRAARRSIETSYSLPVVAKIWEQFYDDAAIHSRL